MTHSRNSGHTQTQSETEAADYIQELLLVKPWLSCLPLKGIKVEKLRALYTIENDGVSEGSVAGEYAKEIAYIESEVAPKRNHMREKKSDLELLHDARFFGKYGDYLFKRLQEKSCSERLGLPEGATKTQVKKAYHKMALVWHPDAIKRNHKYCFANE